VFWLLPKLFVLTLISFSFVIFNPLVLQIQLCSLCQS
jgi:hypothetical protein